jgi:hypothetical protein
VPQLWRVAGLLAELRHREQADEIALVISNGGAAPARYLEPKRDFHVTEKPVK